MSEPTSPSVWHRLVYWLVAAVLRSYVTIRRILFKLGPQGGADRTSEYHLAIVGRKVGFLPAALRQLAENYGPANKLVVNCSAPAENSVLATLHVQTHAGRASRVIFHDSTGSPPDEFSLPPVLDGLIYLVDAPSGGPSQEMPPSMFRGRRFELPLALVVHVPPGPDVPSSPASLVLHDLSGPYASPAVAAQEAERDSASVRLYLVHAGLGDFANALEIRFERVAFFAASTAETQRGTLAPLIWLCHHSGALTDAPAWYQATDHARRFWRRALQGREGRHAANVAWGSIVIGGPLAFVLLAWIFGWKILGLAILGGLAVLFLRFVRQKASL